MNAVITDMSDKLFLFWIDKSNDISSNEQMSVILRYADKGHVIGWFVGIIYITNKNDLSRKEAIDIFFF